MNTNGPQRLGVDFGRVINDAGTEDTTFLRGEEQAAMRTPAMAGVFDVLPRLVEHFEGRVWIVSKCGERIQRRTLRWLAHHDFQDEAIHCAQLAPHISSTTEWTCTRRWKALRRAGISSVYSGLNPGAATTGT